MRRAVLASTGTGPSALHERDTPGSLRLVEALFERMTDWCRARRIPLLVTNGTLLEFTAQPASPDPNAIFLRNAASLFARLAVPYLPVARAHGPLIDPVEDFEIPDDGHPNERGAQLIASTVWPWLRDQLRPVVQRTRS